MNVQCVPDITKWLVREETIGLFSSRIELTVVTLQAECSTDWHFAMHQIMHS